MIEDWWKEIKEKKKQKSKKSKGKIKNTINFKYINDMNRNKNERYKNVYSNEIRPKKMKLIQSKSCNKIKLRNTNVFKKPSKLNIENTYTIKSDIYQLGILLYEMVTLEKPFEANDLLDLIKEILKG